MAMDITPASSVADDYSETVLSGEASDAPAWTQSSHTELWPPSDMSEDCLGLKIVLK